MDDTYLQARDGNTQIFGPGILTNDTVPCGSAVEVELVTPPKHGQVTALRGDGGFTYVQIPGSASNTRHSNRQSRQAQPRAASSGLLVPDAFTYKITCPDTGLVSLMMHSMPGHEPRYVKPPPRVAACQANMHCMAYQAQVPP